MSTWFTEADRARSSPHAPSGAFDRRAVTLVRQSESVATDGQAAVAAAEAAITLFLDYRAVHGQDEEQAKAWALAEIRAVWHAGTDVIRDALMSEELG